MMERDSDSSDSENENEGTNATEFSEIIVGLLYLTPIGEEMPTNWRIIDQVRKRPPLGWVDTFRRCDKILLEISKDHNDEAFLPSPQFLFRAFHLTPLKNVKVVIIGQDPYPNEENACGLAFSVWPGVHVPASLQNIFKELKSDLKKFKIPEHGDLTYWASQGVLLLNKDLTVKPGKSVGGGPMPGAVAEAAAEAGIRVVRTYGMSETAGGCVYDGVPLDGVRVRIDGGRVVLGGATLAKGYRHPTDPDPFAEAGWFRTDDVGAIDDSGVLRILGRIDDGIGTGGLTVLPQLVEAALETLPGIADCAVFGVTDERLGQRVVAAVVLAPGAAAPTLDELRAHVERTLEPTAAPREVHVVAELPRRGIGKVDRKELAARYATGA